MNLSSKHFRSRRSFLLLPLACLCAAARSATLRVPADFDTITEAIAAAGTGDVIQVGPGIYAERISFQGLDITVESTDGPEVTIIDGQGQGPVVGFTAGEGPAATLRGFTVRNGVGLQSPEAGGIWCRRSEPTIVDCIVTGNQGFSGVSQNFSYAGSGGIGIDQASPTIVGCLIESNRGGDISDGVAGAGGVGLQRCGIPGSGSVGRWVSR